VLAGVGGNSHFDRDAIDFDDVDTGFCFPNESESGECCNTEPDEYCGK